MGLTPKQERFCQEYVKTGNKSEAYRLAYDAKNMKPETINEKSVRISKEGKIRARIEELQKEIEKRHNVDIDWCIEKLKAIVEDDEKDRVSAVDKILKYLGGYEKDNDQKKINIDLSRYTDEQIEQKLKEFANANN